MPCRPSASPFAFEDRFLGEITGVISPVTDSFVVTKEGAMKALALLTAAALTVLSVAGCAQYADGYYGKGKAPPPVVTKG